MSKVLSNLTAAVMLAVFLCLGNVQIFAQCTICVSGLDYDCSGTFGGCSGVSAGCSQSSVFQVPCNGYYTLYAALISCDVACTCNSCVWIEKVATGSVPGNVNSNCENQECDNWTTVYLEAGTDLRLYVCKRPCSEPTDCEDCDESCKAQGWLVSVPGPTCP